MCAPGPLLTNSPGPSTQDVQAVTRDHCFFWQKSKVETSKETLALYSIAYGLVAWIENFSVSVHHFARVTPPVACFSNWHQLWSVHCLSVKIGPRNLKYSVFFTEYKEFDKTGQEKASLSKFCHEIESFWVSFFPPKRHSHSENCLAAWNIPKWIPWDSESSSLRFKTDDNETSAMGGP